MNTRRFITWGAAVALTGALGLTGQAAPLTLDGVSAASAAGQLGAKYGVSIVFKGDFGPPKNVSFTVDDADAPGGRLQAINALANALGADFTKTYVVSKVTGDEAVPSAQVDSTALMTFATTTVPTRDAIALVASTDSASAQIAGDIDETVTLSAPSLTVAHAAEEIAKQTHTRWKTFYALTPRGNGRVTGGRVIGVTNGGQAITELPYVYYAPRKSAAQLQQEAEAGLQQSNQQAAAQQQADLNAAAQQQQMMNANGMAMAPNGYVPNGYGNQFGGFNPNGYGNSFSGYGNNYGYNGFGNNPTGYGFNGFGGMGGYGSNGNGLILQGGSGYGYGNGPIIFGGGGY